MERAGIRFVAGVPRNIVDSRVSRASDVCTRAMLGRIVLAIAICMSCGVGNGVRVTGNALPCSDMDHGE